MPLRRSTTVSVGASAQNALERAGNVELRLPDWQAPPSPAESSPVGKRNSLQGFRRQTTTSIGLQPEGPAARRASTPVVGGIGELPRRPNTTSDALLRSPSMSFETEEESVERRVSTPASRPRTSTPAWTNPLDSDHGGKDSVSPKRVTGSLDDDAHRKLSASLTTLGSGAWKLEKTEEENGDAGNSRRGSKDTKRLSTQNADGSPSLTRLDASTAACLDFLSPVKEGQVAFALQRKLKSKALHAKVGLLLQDNPYLQEIVSPLLLPKAERNITQLMALRNFMCMTSMFQEVAENPVLQLEICRCMSLEVFNEKQRIIKEAETGDRAFVLLRGSVAVYRKALGNQECARMRAVWSFGDVALKVDAPRNASVLAAENGTLVSSLSRKDYRRLLVQSAPRTSALRFFTEYFPKLMTDQQRITLAFVTEVRERVPKGCILTEAGQLGYCFFFIRKGTCNVVSDPNAKAEDGAGGVSQLQKLHGRDPSQQRNPKQKAQVQDTGEKEQKSDNEDGDGDDADKDSENEANETQSPKASAVHNRQTVMPGRLGSKGAVLGADLRPSSGASAQSWMWQSRSILVTLAAGDFFGMEACVEGPGLQRNCYSQTVVAASECEILEIPVSQFQQVFPKTVQKTFESHLLSMSGLRNVRGRFLTDSVPTSVTNYSIPERQLVRSRQSGRAKKFTPVKSELKYREWALPEKDLEMEAIAEESPEARIALMEVRLQERTYKMTSSICLQNSPGDLLKPLVGLPRDLTSMGFRHVGPQQRSPPGPKLTKMQGDRKHHRVLLQDVHAEQRDHPQSQFGQTQHTQQDNMLLQMRDQKMNRPRSSPQL